MSRRSGRTETLWAVLACLAVATAFWHPAFEDLAATGFGDWQWFHRQWEVARVALLRFGEVPFWDPHHCGGVPMWGNPQAQVYSPTYLVTLPFGTALGHKLYLVSHCAAGLLGAYFLCRREYELSVVPSAWAALVWGCSGFFAWHGSGGHATYLSFYVGPWLLLAWRKSASDLRYSALVALLMCLLVLEGAHYPGPYFVLLLGLDAVSRMGSWREVGRIVRAGLVGVGLTALLVAARVVPIAMAMGENPNPVEDLDKLELGELLDMLVSRRTDGGRWPGHAWVWAEYGTFVGWIALGIAALGLPRALAKGRRHLLVGLALFGGLTMGAHGPAWPWPLLQSVPFYGSLHVPSRFGVLLTFYLAILGALALESYLRPRPGRAVRGRSPRLRLALAGAVLLLTGADLFQASYAPIDRWHREPIAPDVTDTDFRLVPRYTSTYASFPAQWVGTADCYDPVPWDVPRGLRSGHVPQVWVEGPSGEVERWSRTTQTWSARVALDEPGRVVFNQGHYAGWRSSSGQVVEDARRLAVDLPAGRHALELRYVPPDLPESAAVSAVGLLAALLVGVGLPRRRRRPRRG